MSRGTPFVPIHLREESVFLYWHASHFGFT